MRLHLSTWGFGLLGLVHLVQGQCKCMPGEECWPSDSQWSKFNKTVSGKLIDTLPLAAPCYKGPLANKEACDEVNEEWQSAVFRSSYPLGYAYPLNDSCSQTTFGANNASAQCTLGNLPVYTVNVTTEDDIVKSIAFAKKNNLRVVIKSTGHDFLQRSTGPGSISIWLQHLRNGFTFNDFNPVEDQCASTGWNGTTLTIKGSYAWSDIYPTARTRKVIVVGGNNEGPSSTGGWAQGGGHSPVTRHYGLGADQILSMRVVLASGKIVTTNACQNQDLFYALRGGGGGTYGIVIESTVKTYPTQSVTVATLGIMSAGNDTAPDFLDAVTAVYAAYPGIAKLGFAGYGFWAAYAPLGLVSPKYTNLFQESFITLNTSGSEAKMSFLPFEKEISKFNNTKTGVEVVISWQSYPDYASYYFGKSDTVAKVGAVSAISSHLLGAKSLEGDKDSLRQAVGKFAGAPGDPVFHTLVHHGLEVSDAGAKAKTGSAVHRGWYDSVLLDIFEKQVNGTQVSDNLEAFAKLREDVVPEYHRFSPDTGAYMNEADWGTVEWQEDFFGANYQKLSNIKAKYDSGGIFYCQTCVGSEKWVEHEDGTLCKASA